MENGHAETGSALYLWVWVYLIALTGVEVVLAYEQIFSLHVMLAILMALSLVKAALIVAYFMHLRFERVSLVVSLIPAVVIVISLLSVFFPDSMRLYTLRLH
jgi:cytochrome c oxidase subunit 4